MTANPLGLPIGCQTYPVRASLQADFPGTMKALTDAGFTSIELCSPVCYPEFSALGKYSGQELKRILNGMGVTCVSSHFHMRELRASLEERIAWASDVGMTQMAVATLDGPSAPTMDDVKRAADEYNKIGEAVRPANMWATLHNETFELAMVDGRRVYDVLLELLDPKLVKFQFQVSTVAYGFDAAEYFNRYPGRFISMHCQGWNKNTRQHAAIGSAQDSLDWKNIFAAAKTGGVENYYVEMNFDLMKESVPFLKSLPV
jgi:sugar phosphate isomerase/epimerase